MFRATQVEEMTVFNFKHVWDVEELEALKWFISCLEKNSEGISLRKKIFQTLPLRKNFSEFFLKRKKFSDLFKNFEAWFFSGGMSVEKKYSQILL